MKHRLATRRPFTRAMTMLVRCACLFFSRQCLLRVSWMAWIGIVSGRSLFVNQAGADEKAGRTEQPPVTALVFSPDGDSLLSNGRGEILMRSASTGKLTKALPCSLPGISSLSFHPDGDLLVVGGGDPGLMGGFTLMNWPEGRVIQKALEHKDLVTGAAFSKDGHLLGCSSWDHTVVIWRRGGRDANWERSRKLTGHSGPVLALAFSPGSDQILTAGSDRSIKVWSVTDGRLIRSFSHHLESVNALAVRPGGAEDTGLPYECASASDDRTVRVWQPGIGRMVRIMRAHQAQVLALAWSRDGTRLYAAGKEGIVRCFEAGGDQLVGSLKAANDWIYSLAVSSDRRVLATGDWAGNVKIWPVTQLSGH